MKIIFSILFFFCTYFISSENRKDENAVIFSITPLKTIDESFYEKQNYPYGTFTYFFDKEQIQIKITFSTSTSQKMLFDRFAFCIPCFINADDQIKLSGLKPKTPEAYLELITRSQMLIENEKNEFCMFISFPILSDPYNPKKYRQGDMKYGCGDDYETIVEKRCEDAFEIKPSEPYLDTMTIIKRHLKVKEVDKKVRLHYLFKPDERQRKLGFNKSYILTSNWFSLEK